MQYKLSPEKRDEVNQLIEECQDDLEGVLFRLVWERENVMEKNKMKNLNIPHLLFLTKEAQKALDQVEKLVLEENPDMNAIHVESSAAWGLLESLKDELEILNN